MRTLTAQQSAVLALAKRSVHVRVFVDRGSGDWVALTDLEGRNWVEGIDYSGSIDQAPVSASVSIASKVESLSMSPLMGGSKLNAGGVILEIAHPIYVETATMPIDTPPGAADWVEVFRGEIDQVQWNASPIVVRCRDKIGALDRVIETQVKRPFNLNVDHVETVMQEILDGELGEGVVTIYSITGDATTPFKIADSPGWLIPEYIQRKQPLIQALRVLADQIGWYVRYLWNESTSAFELTFYEPGRELAAQGSLLLTGQPSAAETFVLNSTTVTAVASGAGADEFNIDATVPETAANMAAALNAGSEAANIANAWATGATYASGTMTFVFAGPSATETFVINATTITAVAGAPGADEFQIGGTLTETLDNLVAALRETSAEAANLTAARIGSTVKITWGTAGSAGDAIVLTEAMSNCTVDGAGTLGGTDPGLDAVVTVEWGTKGTAGNAIVWTEALSNCTADGSGTLGGTILGQSTSVDHTFGPDRYHNVTALAVSRAGIRNVVRVKYGVSQLDRTTVEVSDAASIAKYGRRWMEVAEAGSSQIDTESEATRMANAILADLSEPDANQSIEMPYFWPVDLGDFNTYEANGYHYDSDQNLSVLNFRHQLSGSKSRTILSSRGKPSGGFRRWLGLDARPGVAQQNNFYSNNAAEGMAITEGVGLIVVSHDDPRGMKPPINDWAFTRCYLSTSGGFTPSDATLAATSRQTRFELGGLIPGTTYYSKLVIIDSAGNEAATSSQVTTAAEKVGAYHENPDNLRRNMVKNGDFGQATKPIATTPPDGWEVTTGAWGTDITYDASVQETGARSIKWPSTKVGTLTSDFIPVCFNQLYKVETNWTSSDKTAGRIATIAKGYTSAKVFVANLGLSFSDVVADDVFEKQRFYFYPDQIGSTVRFVRLELARTGGSAIVYADYNLMTQAYHQFRVYRSSAQAIAGSAVTDIAHNTIDSEEGDATIGGTVYGFDTANWLFRCLTPGRYYAYGAVTLDGVADGTLIETGFQLNGTPTSTGTSIVVGGAGDQEVMAATIVELVRDDELSHYVYHDDGGGLNTVGGLLKTHFQLGPVSGDG